MIRVTKGRDKNIKNTIIVIISMTSVRVRSLWIKPLSGDSKRNVKLLI